MEIADQDNKKINKVIFNVLYVNINCMYNVFIVFTIFQDLEEKLRAIQALIQENTKNDQVIFDFNMQHYYIFDEFVLLSNRN